MKPKITFMRKCLCVLLVLCVAVDALPIQAHAAGTPTVSTLNNIYDQNPLGGSHKDLVFTVTLNGKTLTGITVPIKTGNTDLILGTQYTVSLSGDTATVTVLSSYLDTLTGSFLPKILTFNFSDSSSVTQNYYVYNTLQVNNPGGYDGESLRPYAVEVDSDGNMYYTDEGTSIIIEYAASDHTQWGIDMKANYTYIIAQKAASDLVIDADGNLYFSGPDELGAIQDDNSVYEMAAADHTQWGINMKAGQLYRIVGTGEAGYSGDGGAATAAKLKKPQGIDVDTAGNIYIADTRNNRVRMVPASSGTYFGIAMTANCIYTLEDGMTQPFNVAVNKRGDLYMTGYSFGLREIAAADHSEWGYDMKAGQKYNHPTINWAFGLALDDAGNIYVSDSAKSIKEIPAADGSNWGIDMKAGQAYVVTYPQEAGFLQWYNIAVDAAGETLYAASPNPGYNIYKHNRYAQNDAQPADAVFDLNANGLNHKDLTYTLPDNLGQLSYIGDSSKPDKGISFSVDGNKVTIPKEALVGYAAGAAYTLNFQFKSGFYVTSCLIVTDTTPNDTELSPVAVDNAGNMYHVLFNNNEVLETPASDGKQWGVDMTAGKTYIVAGSTTGGYASDGTPSTIEAEFGYAEGVTRDATGEVILPKLSHPVKAACDPDGNLYILEGNTASDTIGTRIREVAAKDGVQWGVSMKAGNIYTIAGTGIGYTGTNPADGAVPTETAISMKDMIVDNDGNIFFCEMRGPVYMIPAASGTYYGKPMEAGKIYAVTGECNAWYIAGGKDGDIYIAHSPNVGFLSDYIQELAASDHTRFGIHMTTGNLYTIGGIPYTESGEWRWTASNNGALATETGIGNILGIAVDADNNIYIGTNNYSTNKTAVNMIAAKDGTQWGQNMTAGHFYTVYNIPNTNSDEFPPTANGLAATSDGSLYVGMSNIEFTDHLGSSVTFLKKPATKIDAPASLAWDATVPGKATWDAATGAASYTVQLYKDGTALGSAITGLTNAYYDFTSAIKETGSYTFTVTAVGDGTDYADSDASAASAAYAFVQKLAKPGALYWSSNVARWGQVTGATSYTVQLYKDGTAYGSAITGLTYTSYNFSTTITETGSYTFTVKAIGDGTSYSDSDASSASSAYSYTASAIKLGTPASLAWDTTTKGKATWGAVTGASSYTVQLYKGGTTFGSAVTGITNAYYDLTSAITDTGSYTFTVKAIGDGTSYTDSNTSATSSAYSYTASAVKLGTPASLAWDTTTKGKATWGIVSGASSYTVQLYKGGTAFGSAITGVTNAYYDFTSAITETGSYTFTVKAIGDGTSYTDSDTSSASSVYSYTASAVKLGTPASLAWDSTTKGKATWGAVTGASSYTVQLCKGGTAYGSAVTGVTNTYCDFTSAITDTGSYTFTVKGIGDGTSYTDSDTSSASSAYSYTASAVKLGTPASLAWDTTTKGKATWGAVTGASSYTVQLYKGGTASGSAITGVTNMYYDLTSAITDTGSYTFTVKAIGDGTSYTDSDASSQSSAYSYTKPATPTVTSVTVAPPAPSVQKGTTQSFSATVNGDNSPAQTVTWSISGNSSAGTTISSAGLLTVASGETATSLTVKATSTVDTAKYGTAAVTVTTPATPTVTSVTVAPPAPSVQKGTTQSFSATVNGDNNPAQTVTWSVSGNSSAGTTISSAGVLSVAADETAASLTVKATSTVDTAKSGTADVTVTETPPPTPTVTSVTLTPSTVSVLKGNTQSFSAAVAGDNNPSQTVTWSVSGNSSADTKIGSDGVLTVASGETAASLTVTATSTLDNTKSGTAAVTVTAPVDSETPSITTQPASKTVTVGGSAELSVVAGVSRGTLSYQWYSDTSNSNTKGTAISGAISGTYTASTSEAGTTYYYCVVTNTDGTATGSKTAKAATNAVYVQVNAAESGGSAPSASSSPSVQASTNHNDNNSAEDEYVANKDIVDSKSEVTADIQTGSTLFSAEQMNNLAKINQTKPISIQGNGYTVTFPEGTLSPDADYTDLDLGLTFNNGENYPEISKLSGGNPVLVISYNHSGALPGQATITFDVGTQYAGQTLYFYYYNPNTGELEYKQSAVVDDNGYVSITQSSCSEYVFTKTLLTGASAQASQPVVTSLPTASMVLASEEAKPAAAIQAQTDYSWIYILVGVLAAAGIALAFLILWNRRRKMKQ